MDLRQLEYFVHVAELGSFTKAASALGVAQSALSRHVRRLEVEMGQNLLRRDGRGATPTEAGVRLLRHGRGILMQMQRARQEVDDARGAALGHAVIGMPHSLGRMLTVPIVLAFQREFPQARLSITEGLTSHLHEWLSAGRLDVALLFDPPPSPPLDTVPLLQGDYYLFAPMADPQARKKTVTLEELAGMPLILPRLPHPLRVLVETQLARLGRKPYVVLEIDSVAAIADLVAEGLGYGLVSISAMRVRAREGKFAFRRILAPEMHSLLVVATSAERPATALAQHAVRMLRDLVPRELQGGNT